jgi:spore maturation protein SpmB
VASWQRINLLSAPVLGFMGGFGLLMGGLYAWLAPLPPAEMAQMIGLLGSGIIVSLIALFVGVAAWRGMDVYESFVEGAKEGFGVAVQIIPYLIAMLAAISLFRSSGCMDYLVGGIGSVVVALGMNADFVPALPVGLMKTLSGSGARGLMVDVMTTYGVDSFQGRLAAIIQGSTETTFYVLAVYFGSVNITKTRYAVACGLIADAVGLVGAIGVGYLFYYRGVTRQAATAPASHSTPRETPAQRIADHTPPGSPRRTPAPQFSPATRSPLSAPPGANISSRCPRNRCAAHATSTRAKTP